MNQYDIIFTRRHPYLAQKDYIYKLIWESYVGGFGYIGGNSSSYDNQNLFQFYRESNLEYEVRRKRSVYFNHTKEIAKTLTGLLYTTKPEREVSTELLNFTTKAAKGKSFNSFMQGVGLYSCLFTVGILVDQKGFDTTQIVTKADYLNYGIDPYCVLYLPNKIRDFAIDDRGCIDWVLLDNTYTDNSNPFDSAKNVLQYRLWTKDFYQDFTKINNVATATEQVMHNLGKVPFVFASWEDSEGDGIAETPFEDIALISRAIYNKSSEWDESLSSGTFQTLFYPVAEGEDLPKELKETGFSAMNAVNYNGALSQKPFFDSPKVGDNFAAFEKRIEALEKKMMDLVGLNRDTEKSFAQSGIAKSLEFKKAKATLTVAAEQLQEVEKQIFEFVALWKGTSFDGSIIYNTQFDTSDIDAEVKRLIDSFEAMPYQGVKAELAKQLVNRMLPDLSAEEKDELMEEIDEAEDASEMGAIIGGATQPSSKPIEAKPEENEIEPEEEIPVDNKNMTQGQEDEN